MNKDFFKLFSPVDEKLVNAGTSDGVKKSWETRKGNRIGGSGVDAEYPKNPHDFSKSNLSSDYHKVAGSAAALSSLSQNSGRSVNHELAKGEHLKAARLAAADKNEEQADYHRNMADKHSEQAKATAEPKSPDTEIGTSYGHGVRPNIPHISGDGWGFGRGLSNADSSIQDRLLNSALAGGAKLTVGQLAAGLTEALGDKLTNSKYGITDILCPDETGHWACVLDNSKVFFTLKDGQPLLNWEHKEKQEKDYPDWDEEPKVDGGWDEDLIGGGDEILNSGNSEGVKKSWEARKNALGTGENTHGVFAVHKGQFVPNGDNKYTMPQDVAEACAKHLNENYIPGENRRPDGSGAYHWMSAAE